MCVEKFLGSTRRRQGQSGFDCDLCWRCCFGFWLLVFVVWFFVFGFLHLVFGFSFLVFGCLCLVFGVWCLVFGATNAGQHSKVLLSRSAAAI